jgi:hypothetical protein
MIPICFWQFGDRSGHTFVIRIENGDGVYTLQKRLLDTYPRKFAGNELDDLIMWKVSCNLISPSHF